jgi:hypothetical protein
MHLVNQGNRYAYFSCGALCRNYGAVSQFGAFYTVRVEKSDSPDWTDALAQFGGGNARIRVCVGNNPPYDFTVGVATLSTPSGWSGNGADLAQRSFNLPMTATMEPAAWNYSSATPSGSWNPPAGLYVPADPIFGTGFYLNTALNLQKEYVGQSITQNRSDAVTIHAYQIDAPNSRMAKPPWMDS